MKSSSNVPEPSSISENKKTLDVEIHFKQTMFGVRQLPCTAEHTNGKLVVHCPDMLETIRETILDAMEKD